MTDAEVAIKRHVDEMLDGVPGIDRMRPGTASGEAWATFLRSHASLMRVLDGELLAGAGVSLSDFDVLIQLGLAPGARLRMSELARKTLISRSGMTRRAGQLEERGLVARQPHADDRRSVTITLTDQGADMLQRALPVHVKGVTTHFLDRLSESELTQLRATLDNVVIDCDFG